MQNLVMLGQAALGLGVFFYRRGGSLVCIDLSREEQVAPPRKLRRKK